MIAERPLLEQRVIGSLDAGRIPVLLGGCGMGRTAMLLRLERLIGPDHGQYLDIAAAATTPERCLAEVRKVLRVPRPAPIPEPTSPQAAMKALLFTFDRAAAEKTPVTFLLDEFMDVRTFESFPGLRHVQRDTIAHLALSPARFVLASRFIARVHRALRDAPSRFEVIHMPPLEVSEVRSMALMVDGERRDWAAGIAPAVTVVAGGHAAVVHLLLEALAAMGPAIDPVAALASIFATDGPLTARCRESYEFRLQRARGYGALKAILGILAEDEPRNLTEISLQLRRTPGSTKDYLSWLEDVDLVTVQGKRYSFQDPLLRLYVRMYGHPSPPTDADIVREVGAYARSRLPLASAAAAVGVPVAPRPAAEAAVAAESPAGESGRPSGIIEID